MIDVELLVDVLDSKHLIRKNRIIGNWYSIYCPFHNNGEEKKPSCGVVLHDEYRNGSEYKAGLFHCFSCNKVASLIEGVDYILKDHGIHTDASTWLLENVAGYQPDLDSDDYLIPSDILNQVTSKFAVRSIQTQVQSYVSESELASYRYTVPYMYERKLTDDVIDLYDVGFDINWVPPGRKNPVPCITIPVRDRSGRTLFLCRRSVEGKLYNYPEGVTKPVFGVDVIPKDCNSLLICESAINAMTAHVYGYEAVALLGTGNDFQRRQLRELGVTEFVLCADGDEAGRKASKKWKKWLQDIAIVWTIHMPDGTDLNDCSKEEFDQLYQERE